jgi:nitrate reductase gamma subunit
MSLLDFARGPALEYAFAVFLFGILWRIVSLFLLPRAKDRSVPRPGAPAAAVSAARGFVRHMWLRPPYGQSTVFALVNGYVFHVGLAIIVLGFGPHIFFINGLTGVSWPNLPSGVISVVAVVTLAALAAALVRRLTSPVLRLLSGFNDYMSWLVTTAPVLTGLLAVSHLGAKYETLLAIHILSIAVFLVWFPFGKLFHAFLVFVTRSQTGAFYGRRGVQI